MSRRKKSSTRQRLQSAAQALSAMLEDCAGAARQRQLENGGDAGREMKELTGILKDLAGVMKAMEDDTTVGQSGVVLLPEVKDAREA